MAENKSKKEESDPDIEFRFNPDGGRTKQSKT
jgi:hypothetical protein